MRTITMPQAVNTMQAGTVRRWLRAAGDSVAQGQVLAEIESDEGLIQLEAASAGTLQSILVPAGQTVPVNTPLAHIAEDGEAKAASANGTPVGGSAEPAPAPTPASPGGEPAAAHSAAPASGGPVIPIVMPQAGQSMEEGTIVAWHVQPGDQVKKGQIIFEVETDKATLEVEATDAGRLAKIVLPAGGTIAVKEPVAYLAESDADVDAHLVSQGGAAAAPAATAAAPAAQPQTGAATAPSLTSVDGRVKASPAARKLAAESGVDLATVGAGRGPNGRILSTDVATAATAKPAAAPTAPTPAPAVTAAPATPAAEGEVVRRRMSSMRKVIAQNLLASKQTIPHFYMRLTINADPLVGFYQGEKAKYPCSINDVITLACAKVIQEMPAFRSRIEGEEIATFPGSNIGIAVGLDDGLVVPVIVGVERMSLQQLGSESRRIVTAARGGKITGMGQGVFTISNLGMFGIEEFAAIINPPEAAILAVGTTREEVIVSGGTMRPGRVMTMTLSVDHRVVDGLAAAKFMARLKEILEYPAQLI